MRIPLEAIPGLITGITELVLIVWRIVFRRWAWDADSAVKILETLIKDETIRTALRETKWGRDVVQAMDKFGPIYTAAHVSGRKLAKALYVGKVILRARAEHALREAEYKARHHND